MKVWNGTAFVDPSAFKVWNGTAFVDPELYTWNGTSYDKVWPTFEPFTLENVNLTDEPVPAGASGCWVTLGGAGGGGGSGRRANSGSRYGGGGGGGGAYIPRVFIPASLLGPTYTVSRGIGGSGGSGSSGVSGSGGGPSTFSSGSVILIANGGAGGSGGSTYRVSGGAGGRHPYQGLSPPLTPEARAAMPAVTALVVRMELAPVAVVVASDTRTTPRTLAARTEPAPAQAVTVAAALVVAPSQAPRPEPAASRATTSSNGFSGARPGSGTPWPA
ncbi:hypothetical protein SEA_ARCUSANGELUS_24 [Mycobacterium phage ArcusAngelus]|uniref:Glycine-rich domain-containing protein n=1 Tax=Mycobacterium phage ArcusAngelus TaxID=2315613 RepID=A0A386KSU9_9CAUD|nr:minor tail protein [Mycobacterium phage ArcusAngelus]AYD87773.1 hypothetical protein SEA_ARCUSANGELUS_24 [Mycobacterium phage ArcusAngelus]